MNVPLSRLLFVLIAILTPFGAHGAGAGEGASRCPPTLTIDQIRSLVNEQSGKLVSLRAEFRSWHRRNLGTARHEHYVVAAHANQRFAHLWHGEFANPDDDPRAYIQLLNREGWNILNTYFKRYDVSRKFAVRPYTEKILIHPFFVSLGWWPPGDLSSPVRGKGRRIFHLDTLEDPACRVTGQEQVNGTWCHVVEVTEFDRLWVDCTRGVVTRRVVTSSRDAHRVIALFESDDFREVAPKLFLPHRMRRFFHSGDIDFTTLVDHYDVNNVKDNQFLLDTPPGTLIYDRDTDCFNQIPGGFELMDRLVRWEKRMVEQPVRQKQGFASESAVIGVAGFVAGITASRARSRRDRSVS